MRTKRNQITPVIGYTAMESFLSFLKNADPEEIATSLSQDNPAFTRSSVLREAIFIATSEGADLEDMAFQLSSAPWLLTTLVTRRPWFRALCEESLSRKDLLRHAEEISRIWEAQRIAIAEAACHLLFNDVPTLFEFHKKLAEGNKILGLKTPRQYIPRWVKHAVYHRDRGICHWCERVIGAYNPQTQFDHMIPLAAYGINDVTNVVLSCGKCNRMKSSKSRSVRWQRRLW